MTLTVSDNVPIYEYPLHYSSSIQIDNWHLSCFITSLPEAKPDPFQGFSHFLRHFVENFGLFRIISQQYFRFVSQLHQFANIKLKDKFRLSYFRENFREFILLLAKVPCEKGTKTTKFLLKYGSI